VPTSFGAIYLPRLVQARVQEDRAAQQRELRSYFRVTLWYSAAVVLCVWPLGAMVLGLVLPKYLGDLRYVYLLTPGLTLFGMSNPFAIVFNVLIRYRWYFYAYGLGTLATGALLAGYLLATGTMDLAALSIIKSAVYALMGAVIVAGYRVLTREYPELRFAPFSRARAVAP
jgi:O-antigen/teichoic acid export membrane protein